MPKTVPVITGDRSVDAKMHSLLTLIRRNFEKQGDHLTAMFLTHRIREAASRSKELDPAYVKVIHATMDDALTEIAVSYALMLRTKGDPLEEILGPLLPE